MTAIGLYIAFALLPLKIDWLAFCLAVTIVITAVVVAGTEKLMFELINEINVDTRV